MGGGQWDREDREHSTPKLGRATGWETDGGVWV